MKTKIILIIIILICFSCKKDNSHDDIFIYTYSELNSISFMKMDSSDTIYYDFRGNDNGLFYSIMTAKDKKKIITIFKNIDFENDTIFEQNKLSKRRSFQFYKIKNNSPKRVFIYGNNAPKEYYRFASTMNNFMKKQKKYRLKSGKDWPELKFMIPPPPPSPKIHNNNN